MSTTQIRFDLRQRWQVGTQGLPPSALAFCCDTILTLPHTDCLARNSQVDEAIGLCQQALSAAVAKADADAAQRVCGVCTRACALHHFQTGIRFAYNATAPAPSASTLILGRDGDICT